MNNIKNSTIEKEIGLSVFLATSMILLIIHPPTGWILCFIFCSLIILFYVFMAFRLLFSTSRRKAGFNFVDGMNYSIAALALAFLLVNITLLQNSFIPGLIVIPLLIVCLAANLLIAIFPETVTNITG